MGTHVTHASWGAVGVRSRGDLLIWHWARPEPEPGGRARACLQRRSARGQTNPLPTREPLRGAGVRRGVKCAYGIRLRMAMHACDESRVRPWYLVSRAQVPEQVRHTSLASRAL